MSRVGARRERERVVVKPPAFGVLDRPRTEASAGRAYLVCRAGFRGPRHAARAGHRAFHSRVRSRPEMYLGSASYGEAAPGGVRRSTASAGGTTAGAGRARILRAASTASRRSTSLGPSLA